VIEGSWYCMDVCLERALADSVQRARSASRKTSAPHRIPLGLLLLSRQQLTVDELRAALLAQRAAGYGRIGEWLQSLGFVNEQQVTAALARQWSCPVLREGSWNLGSGRAPQIPLALLESYAMVPVNFVETTATLHIAFGERIDYRVLYAIEQMLGCRTEPCVAAPSLLRKNLQTLSERREEHEIVFERVADAAEYARIIRSYSIRITASEIRMACCGPHLWVRLLRPSGTPLDLLLRSPRETASLASPAPFLAAVAAV